MGELPDAKKWFGGFFDVTRYIKDLGTIFRMVLIIGVIYLVGIGGLAMYKRIAAKPAKTTIGAVSGGKVDASTNGTKTKIGVLNF